MRLLVEDGAVASGAERIATTARGATELAGHVGRVAAVPRRLEPAPGREAASGLAELTEVCQAALELVALDLDAVSGLMRRAAAIYAAVERGVAAAAESGRSGGVGR